MHNTFQNGAQDTNVRKTRQNTFKRVCKALPYQGTIQNIQNNAEATDVEYNQIEHMQNSVRGASVKKSNTTYSKQCARHYSNKKSYRTFSKQCAGY